MIKFNNEKLMFEKFPNGETKVNEKQIMDIIENSNPKDFEISLFYENDEDLIKLMFVKCYLDDIKLEDYYDLKLIITYMPYSRMDRVEIRNAFTLKYVANFINNLNFRKVIIVQPHSDVTMALVNNSQRFDASVKLTEELMENINFNKEVDMLYYPDGSSYKNFCKYFEGYKHIVAFKHRDFKTGEITDIKLVGDEITKGARIIMIDDLICGGRTFVEGAKKLKEMGIENCYIVTAHSEQFMFNENLFNNSVIKGIKTTDSIPKRIPDLEYLKKVEEGFLEIKQIEGVENNVRL